MDDDVFFDEVPDQDRLFAERERARSHRELWNAGYLAGIEWAEAHYLTEEYDFTKGVEAGLAQVPVALFAEAGRLK